MSGVRSQSSLKSQNARMRKALLAILERSDGKLYSTDQKTGKTFDEIAREALADDEVTRG